MENESNQFMYFLNEKLREEERFFKLKEAILSGDMLTVRLLYSAEKAPILTDSLKEKVQLYTRNTVPESYNVRVEYIRTYSDESTIKTSLMNFLYEEAVLIYPKLKNTEPEIEIEPYLIRVTLTVPDYAYGYCVSSGLKEKIEEHLAKNFMEDGEVMFLPKEENLVFERGKVAKRAESVKTIDIEYDIGMTHLGAISREPRYIKDVIKNESPSQTVCGTVSNFRTIVTKDQTRTFYTFRLNDTTATMEVKAFPRIKDTVAHKNFALIEDGVMIAAEGEIKDDSFSKGKAMFIKHFTACKIDFGSISDKIEYLELPKQYATVRPEAYHEVEFEAVDMFHINEALPEALADKTYVVFDFETTGLSSATDSPIEIGAVKMVNGVMTEIFSTFIEPIYQDGQQGLSAKIIELTGITDEMLAGAPKQSAIAGDIYKFFFGAALVAHNADFDMGFLRKLGDENGYLFDNPYLDTIKITRERVKTPKTNLSFMCEKFDIDLTGAHRAVNDAIATAKLFKKLVAIPLSKGKKV